ncbi:MAG: ASKHA domain-containing protein [Clostridia bacterium]|nr:ASKHA domain-containing protein [Clostridia bacterium]
MDRVKVVLSTGQEIETEKGNSLAEVLAVNGMKIDLPCGGRGKCGGCKVTVKPLAGIEQEQVLACSYKVLSDIWVDIPQGLENPGAQILASGNKTPFLLNSGFVKVYDANQHETSVLLGDEVIAKEFGDTTRACYGLAVDIGTTTVVGYLMDLLTGEQLAVSSGLNGQRVFGADVISRINAVYTKESNLEQLQKQVIETINNIIAAVIQKVNIATDNIYAVTLAGNTCMHHLALGLNPKGLGQAPFAPVIQHPVEVTADSLGLALNPGARVWVFPVIAGFVGGDTVAAILASDLHQLEDGRVLIDIGTNGELVVKANGRMMACSAAAGPALEGAQVTYGMRAETGAISHIQLMPELKIEVIGEGPIKGICGSGLIDLLAELIKAGLINGRGKLCDPQSCNGPSHLKERLVKTDKGVRFIVQRPEENEGSEIFFSQADISQIQLAKGALRAALELLVKKVGLNGAEVEEVLLAGAFGNFMNVQQAVVIGLLPEWAEGKVSMMGNGAGEGAKMALLSLEKRVEAEEISQKVEFLELAGTADFQAAFIKGMLFNG